MYLCVQYVSVCAICICLYNMYLFVYYAPVCAICTCVYIMYLCVQYVSVCAICVSNMHLNLDNFSFVEHNFCFTLQLITNIILNTQIQLDEEKTQPVIVEKVFFMRKYGLGDFHATTHPALYHSFTQHKAGILKWKQNIDLT